MSQASPELLVTAVARDRRQVASDLVALTKPRVVVMVLVTTLVGALALGLAFAAAGVGQALAPSARSARRVLLVSLLYLPLLLGLLAFDRI